MYYIDTPAGLEASTSAFPAERSPTSDDLQLRARRRRADGLTVDATGDIWVAFWKDGWPVRCRLSGDDADGRHWPASLDESPQRARHELRVRRRGSSGSW